MTATTNIPPGSRVVGTRGHCCNGTTNNTGNPTLFQSRLRVEFPAGATGIRVAYSNFLNGDTPAANAIAAITCSIEWSDGTIYPGVVGASASASLAAGADIVFDVGGLTVPNGGGHAWARTCARVLPGQSLPSTQFLAPGSFGDGGYAGDAWQQDAYGGSASDELNPPGSIDLTTGGDFTVPNLYDRGVYGPIAILGTPTEDLPVPVTIFGDSINQSVTDRSLYNGYVAYRLEDREGAGDPVHPYVNLAQNGEGLAGLTSGLASSYRVAVARALESTVVGALSVNDLKNARTAAQINADLATFAGAFPGRTVCYCTTTPETSSSNGWSDPDDQTTANAWMAPGAARDQVLAYLRGDGAALFNAVFDVAERFRALAPGGSPYKWPTGGYTVDGLHLTLLGDAVAASAIDKSKLAPSPRLAVTAPNGDPLPPGGTYAAGDVRHNSTKTFTLTNPGTVDAENVTIAVPAGTTLVAGAPTVVPAGESRQYRVRFSTAGASVDGDMVVTADGVADYTVGLTATVGERVAGGATGSVAAAFPGMGIDLLGE